MGGWVDLGGWLCTRMVHLSADSHTSSPSTVVSRLRWWRPNHICRHVCGMWRRKCMLKLFVRSMTKLILFVCVYWRRGMGRVQVPPFCPKFQFVRNFFSEIQNLGFWTANFGRNLGGGGQKWTFQFTGTFSVRSLQKNSTSCVTAPPNFLTQNAAVIHYMRVWNLSTEWLNLAECIYTVSQKKPDPCYLLQ